MFYHFCTLKWRQIGEKSFLGSMLTFYTTHAKNYSKIVFIFHFVCVLNGVTPDPGPSLSILGHVPPRPR